MMKTTTKLWLGIVILLFLSPLGLILPEYFKAGDAWGEWGIEGIRELTGYLPDGLRKLSGFWRAPLSDYTFQGYGEKSLANLSFSYIISALIGILACAGIAVLLGKFLSKKNN